MRNITSVTASSSEFYNTNCYPVREFGLKYRSLSGKYFSKKNNRLISFESSLENDFAEILEFDSAVVRYVEQPARINFEKTWYHPDFFVIYDDAKRINEGIKNAYYEVKYASEIKTLGIKGQRRFEKIKASIDEMGFEFKIVTDNEIRTDFLKNIKFLGYYKYKPTDPIIRELVMDIARTETFFNPNDIKTLIPGGMYEKAHAIFVIWNLVANQILTCDLRSLLNMETEIWLNI
ncbi:MAG: TnsA endonuclease N-terminal domain-containing protein [Cyclobacteriaceae bacterium]